MMEFQFTCQKCGGHEINIPEGATDESPITCVSCGEKLCTWGELEAVKLNLSKQNAAEEFKKAIREGVKGIDGIKFEE